MVMKTMIYQIAGFDVDRSCPDPVFFPDRSLITMIFVRACSTVFIWDGKVFIIDFEQRSKTLKDLRDLNNFLATIEHPPIIVGVDT